MTRQGDEFQTDETTMTEQDRRPRGETTGWFFYLAAWGVSSIAVGVLLGRYLKQVSADYPLAKPGAAPSARTRAPRTVD
jgi:hypothetical protein